MGWGAQVPLTRWLLGAALALLLSIDGWGCAHQPEPVVVRLQLALGDWCCEDRSADWVTCGFDKQSVDAWVYGTCWNQVQFHRPEVKPVFHDVPERCGRCARW